VLVLPFASGKGVTVPPESTVWLVLLLNAVLYILVIEVIGPVLFPIILPVVTIVAPLYSELGVMPLPWMPLNKIKIKNKGR
jgi:hypothetical protein